MLAPFTELLDGHRRRGSALVSFTCYNLETATGALAAADELGVGVVLLIAQKAFRARSGPALLVALRAAAEVSKAPACVQLDHTEDLDQIRAAFDLGAGAVMADGSRLPLDDNAAFVRDAAAIATAHGGSVEAELGRIEGDEDVAAAAAAGLLTDPAQAADFVRGAGPACLAVSIGNVHGVYRDEPRLDWDRLTRIGAATGVPLSLHGSSGLPDADLRRAVRTGVCKINLNTELRQRYLQVTVDRLASAQDGWRVLELNRAVADGIRAIALDKLLVAGAERWTGGKSSSRSTTPKGVPAVRMAEGSIEVQAAEEATALQRRCVEARLRTLDLVEVAGSGHYGPAFSCIEVFVSLYYGYLDVRPQEPDWPERDRFILSKGHACSSLYPILADLGYFDERHLRTFTRLGSILGDHPDMNKIPGFDFSSGSLGHGLSVGVGMAEALRFTGRASRVVVLLGDGELNEGQVWEAAAYAAHRRLGSVLGIVDANGVSVDGTTTDVLQFEPLVDKWRSFGWRVERLDGHDVGALRDAYARYDDLRRQPDAPPTMLVADTIAGRGISFIEGMAEWHVGYLAGADRERAIADITAMYGVGEDRP